MKRTFFVISSIIAPLFYFSYALANWYSDGDYPGQWQDRSEIGITRALVKNNVKGCGFYRYKESTKHNNEYMVQCSRDGKKWVTWIVWVGIDKVQFAK